MIGHTGNLEAAIKAIKVLDKCIKRILKIALPNYVILITADHGNCEEMIDFRSGGIMTEHTNNPVPFYLVSSELQSNVSLRDGLDIKSRPAGFLSDIAPTILDLMKMKKPSSMTGISLLRILGVK